MAHRFVLIILLFACLVVRPSVHSSFAQTPREQAPSTLPETPSTPAPHQSERLLPELLPHEGDDAVSVLGELRGNVRMFPQSADHRLKLAEGLYRIGDLDTAIDECHAAIALKPDHARAHLQLGMALMAKQDWRASLTEFLSGAVLA